MAYRKVKTMSKAKTMTEAELTTRLHRLARHCVSQPIGGAGAHYPRVKTDDRELVAAGVGYVLPARTIEYDKRKRGRVLREMTGAGYIRPAQTGTDDYWEILPSVFEAIAKRPDLGALARRYNIADDKGARHGIPLLSLDVPAQAYILTRIDEYRWSWATGYDRRPVIPTDPTAPKPELAASDAVLVVADDAFDAAVAEIVREDLLKRATADGDRFRGWLAERIGHEISGVNVKTDNDGWLGGGVTIDLDAPHTISNRIADRITRLSSELATLTRLAAIQDWPSAIEEYRAEVETLVSDYLEKKSADGVSNQADSASV